MKVKFSQIPLNIIRIEVDSTPESLKDFGPPKAVVEKYRRILKRYQFADYMRVWTDGKKYVLISSFACYRAHQEYLNRTPEQKVGCLVISDATKQEALDHGKQIQQLMNQDIRDNSIPQLLHVKSVLLADPNAKLADLQEQQGLKGEAKSGPGKQLYRVYKVAAPDVLFCAVTGIKNINQKQLVPNLDEATLTYTFCLNKIVPILGENKKAIERFGKKLNEYINSIRQKAQPDDAAAKSIRDWEGYSRERIIQYARASVAENPDGLCENHPDNEVVQWNVSANDFGKVSVPIFHYDQRDISEENYRRCLEFAHVAERAAANVRAFIKQIGPEEHGQKIRKQAKDSAPYHPPSMNNLDMTNGYFQEIRRTKSIAICNNYDRLLRSLGLHPGIFRFSSAKAGALGTASEAAQGFEEWYDRQFINEIAFRTHPGRPEEHEFYDIYKWMKERLDLMALSELTAKKCDRIPKDRKIKLRDLCTNLFTAVFKRMDDVEANDKRELIEFRKLVGRGQLGETLSSLRKQLCAELEVTGKSNGKTKKQKQRIQKSRNKKK